ncbi:Uncharacterised protein [Sphingobacterium spiritivorum]|uniref:PRTase-CE domain-containing protein n=1 Tax=Sphingobacterium spiritivorum TaxID=258 RepID=A0A380CA50_SPHSI|nr:hypothetical protein [Sphingobacterium spiritivorum]SUJ16215.1 Uncharacterised protein [Sphingobacterium spiritivorum]
MSDPIDSIVDIIKDYRKENISDEGVVMDKAHVNKWINQFDAESREFVLNELLHLLRKSYLSYDQVSNHIRNMFGIISSELSYNTVNELLNHSIFQRTQKEYKSQHLYLGLIEHWLEIDYKIKINTSDSSIQNIFYIDDILGSGGTFIREIKEVINDIGLRNFLDKKIKIICCFTVLHRWAMRNVKFQLQNILKVDKSYIDNHFKFYRVFEIENDPHIGFGNNDNPSFDHVYPIETPLGNEVLGFIQANIRNDYEFRNEKHAFRNEDYPVQESYFSSNYNRKRYEYILLEKGFEIMKRIDFEMARGLRPLGMTNPSNKTLGTGTHYFSWRNISNTCPLVFWWGKNDWYPLFPVQNRGL